MATKDKVAGTNLTADDYLNNAGWVQTGRGLFEYFDQDKDGVISITDIVIESKRYAHLNPDPEVIEKFRIAQCECAEELGVKPGISITRDDYVKNLATLAPREVEKVRNGEESIIHKLNNRMFDMLDKNHNGTILKEELRAFIQATGIHDANIADYMFDIIDTNKSGRLEKKEFSDYQYKVTFTFESVPGKDKIVNFFKNPVETEAKV